ncbi:hypothetical protein BDZ45DRAFT_740368 [Acephala macrosclerotiorum]|nr:hypothetical protein BDZ45DRAFT_740368 [Acephala macrosclerotiorum]
MKSKQGLIAPFCRGECSGELGLNGRTLASTGRRRSKGSSFPFSSVGLPGNIPLICPYLHSQANLVLYDTRVSALDKEVGSWSNTETIPSAGKRRRQNYRPKHSLSRFPNDYMNAAMNIPYLHDLAATNPKSVGALATGFSNMMWCGTSQATGSISLPTPRNPINGENKVFVR